MYDFRKQHHTPAGRHGLRGWRERRRESRVAAEIRAILSIHQPAQPADEPEFHTTLPAVWNHKTEALAGDTVYLRHNNTIRAFILSALDEADPETCKVSITSPIGSALLGRHQGDTVHLMALDGDFNYTILKII